MVQRFSEIGENLTLASRAVYYSVAPSSFLWQLRVLMHRQVLHMMRHPIVFTGQVTIALPPSPPSLGATNPPSHVKESLHM